MPTRLYKQEDKELWNTFVKEARNATFLFDRDFMDYHKDRFTDCSLLFTNSKGKLTGILPANICKEEHKVVSHGGLTYGGLLLKKDTSLLDVKEMLKSAALLYLNMGVKTLRYKPLPYIYHKYPSQEDLYWLYRSDATLIARAVSTTIDLTQPLPFSTLRKRKVKKANSEYLRIHTGEMADWEVYWNILTQVLQKQHQTFPVHTLNEILKLATAFPQQIQLHTVYEEGTCIAGCVTFDCGEVLHVQYIASNEQGREVGALDFLFQHLITANQAKGKHYFDFGISTEDNGKWLNEGLLFQKEGFGGRAVCYDIFEIQLEKIFQL